MVNLMKELPKISTLLYNGLKAHYVKPQQQCLFHLFSRRQYSTESNQIRLRDYQQKCIDSCLDALNNKRRRIGVSLPTGGGKTVVFSSLIDQVKPREGYGNKTLILAHRTELIQQAAKTVKSILPSKLIEVEMAKYHSSGDCDVVVASVQTLMRGRLEKFNPKDFKLLIIDEAHHAAADSYRKIIDYFGGTHSNSDVAITGFSATLQRDDDKNLSDAFDEVVFHMTTDEMVKSKHLSEAKFTTVRLSNADLSKVGVSKGEFVISKLSKAVNNDINNELVLRTYLHFVSTLKVKSTMLFGVDIKHVKDLTELFRNRGINADYVTANTHAKVRVEVVDDFRKGKIQVLMNCGIFTEGTDIPNIDCLLLVRPTASKNLLIQMIGRGLRLHKSKEFCHIVDFVGINNNNIVSVPTLHGLPGDAEIRDLTPEQIEERRIKHEKYLERKEQELEKQKQLELKMEILKAEEYLKTGVRDDAPVVEVDESQFMNTNIDLRTFESFEEFLKNGDLGKETDLYYIASSQYPLCRIDNNTWVLPYPSGKGDIHLRLQRHQRLVTKEFFKAVSVTGIYKTKSQAEALRDAKGPIYTLASYTLNPRFGEKMWDKMYKSKLLLPFSKDVRIPLSYITKLLREVAGARNLTKTAFWRSEPPTIKQLRSVVAMMKRSSKKLEITHINQLPNLTKGEVADFMTSVNISNTQYPRSILYNKLQKKAKEQEELYPEKTLKSEYEILHPSAPEKSTRSFEDSSAVFEDTSIDKPMSYQNFKESEKQRQKKLQNVRRKYLYSKGGSSPGSRSLEGFHEPKF
ncbi:ATP-dependent RNA helicase [Wickerhamomyces ciferrii]|uniref:ATP-dependent RNA helicase n=1 Tax=Wickerhamomyces ciferrii (strain ATCC 14091 / BCRC 22168 / CBS 111 / JCM 3599 / NBRC 0793 / NRRL Y-1031 F-60-10) TaxID=1206466 RepID=K0KM38_WICCF|nr:ATP-dependent RNA helicase [Wickerhamomyces ciferrii]CCH44066.1 ATP-dependent RNA helicase [Wickerhamomyces ciferrii]